jgi:hypothetical protein
MRSNAWPSEFPDYSDPPAVASRPQASSRERSLQATLNSIRSSHERDLDSGASMILARKHILVPIILVCAAFGITSFIRFQGMRATIDVRDNAISPALPQTAAAQVSLAHKPPVKMQATPAVDWEREFNASSDYFSFVSKAARKAYAGDGRAAVFISKALYLCLPIMREYSDSKDPQSDFDSAWSARIKGPQWVMEKARRDFHICAGFLEADAFAELPERAGNYYSVRYWSDESLKDGDPIAQAQEAGDDIVRTVLQESSGVNSKYLESAQLAINKAVASQDPAALFQVGRLLSTGPASNDPLQGFAVSIAACNLGYDCTTTNVALFNDCAALGTCATGMNYADIIKLTIGDDGYAQAYARAQQIQEAIARRDTKTLEQFAQLKRNP